MQNTDLDTFPGEDKTTSSTRIVITDDQLRSSWETFPTEQTPQAESKPTDPTDDPLANVIITRPSLADMPMAQPVVVKRRRSLVPAAVMAAVAFALFAGPEIARRLATPLPVQASRPIQSPARAPAPASSEGANADAVVPAAAEIEHAADANPAAQPAPEVATTREPLRVNSLPPSSVTRAAAAPRTTVQGPSRVAQP